MNITYDKDNGLFVADGKAVETAKSILENNKDVTVSQGLLVDAIRLNMKENNIPKMHQIFCVRQGSTLCS